jgi:ParB family transcriptional regulator, chromosome partitioning protein
MSTITPRDSGELRLALDDIRVRENVRDLDVDHVDNLAQSIALRGLLVPLIVRPIDGGYELVAGYHRIAACRQLGSRMRRSWCASTRAQVPTAPRRTSRASS